jgi:hypothetical protein
MKRNLYLLLALLVAGFSGCDNEPKFKVEGSVAGADKQTLYFEASAVGGVELLDSAVLHGDGSFSFKGKRPESPEFYRLRLGNKVINFAVDSTETVSVSAAADNFATGYTIEGSDNNVKIKELVLLQSDQRHPRRHRPGQPPCHGERLQGQGEA